MLNHSLIIVQQINYKKVKFFFEKDFEIENIKDALLSIVKKYFIKRYTGE